MSNEKVIVEVVNKIRNHRETFAFHDNERADHDVVGKPVPAVFGEFRDKGEIQVEEKGIIKLSNRLRSKKTDVLQNFLTIDNNQLLSVN